MGLLPTWHPGGRSRLGRLFPPRTPAGTLGERGRPERVVYRGRPAPSFHGRRVLTSHADPDHEDGGRRVQRPGFRPVHRTGAGEPLAGGQVRPGILRARRLGHHGRLIHRAGPHLRRAEVRPAVARKPHPHPPSGRCPNRPVCDLQAHPVGHAHRAAIHRPIHPHPGNAQHSLRDGRSAHPGHRPLPTPGYRNGAHHPLHLLHRGNRWGPDLVHVRRRLGTPSYHLGPDRPLLDHRWLDHVPGRPPRPP